MAFGLSLSTLGNLGRVASRGVEQHAQKRQGDADRELSKVMLHAAVSGDYSRLSEGLQQGLFNNAQPKLINAAGETVSRGLLLKREEEYTKRQKEYEIEEREFEKIKGDADRYGFMTPDEQKEEARSIARRVVSGVDPGGGRPAAGGGRLRGTADITGMVKDIKRIEDEEERIEKGKEAIKRIRDAYQTGGRTGMTEAQYENAISRIENAVYGSWYGVGKTIQEYGGTVLGGAASGARFGLKGALAGAVAAPIAKATFGDFDFRSLGTGIFGNGLGR
jgi:hypothetical protein